MVENNIPTFDSPNNKNMTFIKKRFDAIFILIIALILLILSEYGNVDKLAKFALVFALGCYYAGKYVSRWQQKAKA